MINRWVRLKDGPVIVCKAQADWPWDTGRRQAEIRHTPSTPSTWPAGHLGRGSWPIPALLLSQMPGVQRPVLSSQEQEQRGGTLASQEDALGGMLGVPRGGGEIGT